MVNLAANWVDFKHFWHFFLVRTNLGQCNKKAGEKGGRWEIAKTTMKTLFDESKKHHDSWLRIKICLISDFLIMYKLYVGATYVYIARMQLHAVWFGYMRLGYALR